MKPAKDWLGPIPIIDPTKPLHPSGKLWCGSRNFSWNTALYTRAIAYGLREFGQVKVMCSTIHVNDRVARSRIQNAALRLGLKVTTKVYRCWPETDYVIGKVVNIPGPDTWYYIDEYGFRKRDDQAVLRSLKEARAQVGDSLATVARFVGCSSTTIRRYERGESCSGNAQGNISSYGWIMSGIEKYITEVLRRKHEQLQTP